MTLASCQHCAGMTRCYRHEILIENTSWCLLMHRVACTE